MITTTPRRLVATLAGVALAVVALSGCVSHGPASQKDLDSDVSGGIGIENTHDYFGDGNYVTKGKTVSGVREQSDAIAHGYLPVGLPDKATDIHYLTGNDKVYASWKGAQAADASCTATPDLTVPAFPSEVRHTGTATDVKTCGDTYQATVGGYTYFWGAVTA